MSLKSIHILFICASIILALWFGQWCLHSYGEEKAGSYLVLGILDLLALGGLIAYIVWFVRKLRSGVFDK